MVTSFIFDFDKELCTSAQCKKIKQHNTYEKNQPLDLMILISKGK